MPRRIFPLVILKGVCRMSGLLLAPRTSPRLAGLLLPCLILAIGCGDKKATLTGSVRYRNQALPSGTVTIFNADKQIVGSSSIADGKYTVQKVPVGPVKISVMVPYTPPNDRRHPPPPDIPGGKPAASVPIPFVYGSPETSKLSYDAKPGKQDFSIDLQ
jgi:hypothetical protein